MTHRYFQTVAGADVTSAGDTTELKRELDEDLSIVVFRFLLISSGAQLGRSGIKHLGCLSFMLVP